MDVGCHYTVRRVKIIVKIGLVLPKNEKILYGKFMSTHSRVKPDQFS